MIPKAEKKEIKTEIKQEPGIQGMQIKQELDIRSSSISGRKDKGRIMFLVIIVIFLC